MLQGKGVVQGPQVEGHVGQEAGHRRAERRPGGQQLHAVQERLRLGPQAALQERHAEEGPGPVRARLGQPEGRHDLRADARQDRQQDRRVAAANDGLANAVVVALKAHKLKPIPLSGQDATSQGVQNIISGWQTMTVWKDVRKLATAAAKAAVAISRAEGHDDR